ncbi:hypothetical protein CUZ93_0896 [Enterococcus xinjiangensis]|nr:hypothetical protein [Enterococcus lactis]MBL5000084.1 hypothetical protein [Enterococcus lactis]
MIIFFFHFFFLLNFGKQKIHSDKMSKWIEKSENKLKK